ncbi:MAG TPA: glycosyltransferase family 4 protein [Xanthobacteraceae bacterium]|jgi:glycosyltransferase involved in cell wall biosynthesis
MSSFNACGSSPRLVYLVTEDWYFSSHRLPMARAAREAGFEVHVITRVARHGPAIAAEGFALHHIEWRRGSLDPRHLLRTVRDIRSLYRKLDPSIAHHVALLPTIAGSLAALGLPVVCLNAITGLGTTFSSDSAKLRATRMLLKAVLRVLLARTRSAVLVQNPHDARTIERLGVERSRITLIPGSGVDIERLKPMPEPGEPITIGFAGRLLESKGIRTLVAAHELLQRCGPRTALLIAGLPDPANPGSVQEDEIAAWRRRRDLVHLGFVDDIATVWAAAHIAVLPSRGGEGVPLSLIEAAACGRPLIATDTPGCRDIARNGINAVLVPPDDAEKLAEAIGRLAGDRELRARLGRSGRKLVEQEFSSVRVGRDTVALYRQLLAKHGRRP